MNFPLLRKIKQELVELDEIPLFGSTPPFPWERFSSLLTSRLGLPALSVKPAGALWCEWADISKASAICLAFSLHPIEGHVFWILSHKDLARLTSWMLTGKSKNRSVTAELLQEGFYRYVLLEALDCLQEIAPFEKITLQMNDQASAFDGPVFCLDIEIGFEEKSGWGKLVIPAPFRKKWIAHFAQSAQHSIPPETARVTELDLSIQTGSVVLSQAELASLEKGDFVLLDHSGLIQANLGPIPLFKCKQKSDDQLEIIDYAEHGEAKMAKHAEEEVKSLKDLPVTVVVEAARIKMSLEKLMHLQPGNLLELSYPFTQNVSLTVNGQCVGKAEIVELGETLGLRILEIG